MDMNIRRTLTAATKRGPMPFCHITAKVPVTRSTDEIRMVRSTFPDFRFCLYIGHKELDGWDMSTSRVYMNQVLPNFIYLPIEVAGGNNALLRSVYEYACQDDQVIAINHTNPHKNNAVLMEMFGKDSNADALIRNSHDFVPYNLNGPSFMGWFNETVGQFTDKTVIVFGVGGVGTPIAKLISSQSPARLFLVDIADKSTLAQELSADGAEVSYHRSLQGLDLAGTPGNHILLNCSGKEGSITQTALDPVLSAYAGMGNIFVDVRPHLDIPEVQQAKGLGWRAFTGSGMNARNDYTLLEKIAENLGLQPIPFSVFSELVYAAS